MFLSLTRTVFTIMSWRIHSLAYAFNYVLINLERFVLFSPKRPQKVGWKKLKFNCGASNIFHWNRFSERKINIDEWLCSPLLLPASASNTKSFAIAHWKLFGLLTSFSFSLPERNFVYFPLLELTRSCCLLFGVHDSLLFPNNNPTEKRRKHRTIIIN